VLEIVNNFSDAPHRLWLLEEVIEDQPAAQNQHSQRDCDRKVDPQVLRDYPLVLRRIRGDQLNIPFILKTLYEER